MPNQPDNLDKASQAGGLAGEFANSVADSGILDPKAATTARKVGLGFSFLSNLLVAAKALFGKK